MCQFFSCISDGKGQVRFFKPEDIATIMAEGNPANYIFNSHTSIAHFTGLSATEEDKWNKWEYKPETQELTIATLNADDDRKEVGKALAEWFKNKKIGYLRNLYNCNTGNCNTGYRNTGDYNTGACNTGDCNTGNCNTGDRNTGYRNSGNCNTGDRNTGDYNTGACNTGDCNIGYCNTGDYNTGNYNTGNCNSGNCNTGYHNTGWFNTDEPKARFFNQESNMTLTEFYNSNKVPVIDLPICEFVNSADMSDIEKSQNPNHTTLGGFLRVLDYKAAWAKFWSSTDAENKAKILSLPNFNQAIFEEITGLKLS